MGFFQGIGQGISNGVQWTGEKAKAAGSAIKHGAGVVWDKTADVANSAANYGAAAQSATNLLTSGDVAMRKLPGKQEGYPGKWCANEAVPEHITVKLPFVRGAQKAAAVANAQTGTGTTVQAPGQSFLYLDVGRWGGTGAEGKRDFGIVCGRTAALCTFTQGSGGRHYKDYGGVTKLTKGPQDEIDPINALLGKLAGSELGTPKVRRYLWSKAALPPGVSSLAQKVYIIFGDMHLPVVTKLDEKGKPTAGSPQPKEQADLMGRRMGRTRRVDKFKDLGIESDSDAALWHERYVAAEIFEEAGKDLAILAGLLGGARGNLGKAELWVMQLGDMFDMWLGFDCFFAQDPKKGQGRIGNDGKVLLQDMVKPPDPPPIDPSVMAAGMMGGGMVMPYIAPKQDGTKLQDVTARTVCTAHEFVETWVNRTLYNTSQGHDIQTFLQANRQGCTFLYGNHDNYLGNFVPKPLQLLNGGKSVLPKEMHDAKGLLYASHGHAWDKYNRDGAIAGEGTTQAAFWGGQKVRNLEDLSDSREDYFLGAVDLFRSGKKPFNVFAMGHTHTAVLTEVRIEMEPEPEPIDYTPMMIGP